MDIETAIAKMPAHEDSDEAWRQWADDYPIVRASGLRCASVTEGSAHFVVDGEAFPLNPNGAVNGGVVALAADQVMGVTAIRSAPTGAMPVTASFHTQFHSPAYPPLTFRSEILAGGKVVQAIEVIVHDAEGRRCATAVGTMAVGRVRTGCDAEVSA